MRGMGKNDILTKDGVSLILPFAMITTCFVVWGIGNDITAPMVKAFSKIFKISVTEATMVQVVFHLGYFLMAFPAAMFMQRYSFKSGILAALGIYAVGALLFIPAKEIGLFTPFLGAYFVMTCGISFLETACNPYIYCMGTEYTAIRRLNLAQAFNAVGALLGMFIALHFVQDRMSPLSSESRRELPDIQWEIIKNHDLSIVIQPYMFIAAIVIVLLVLIRLQKMENSYDTHSDKPLLQSIKELWQIRNYRMGVLAEFIYTGAQVCCWTFIIQYGTRVLMAEGIDEGAAEMLSQKYNIYALILFTGGRFICTVLMNYLTAERLLSFLAIAAMACVCGAILFTDRNGLYCLVLVSGCMSLMFPTIFGLSLRGLGENVKIGGAGLVMSLLGGSIFPVVQSLIIDTNLHIGSLPATNTSFIVPLICFGVIAYYGHKSYLRHHVTGEYDVKRI